MNEKVEIVREELARRKGIVMSEFKREERFIVIKRKNLRPIDERELHTWLQQNDIQTCECVVVESDWPEYEQVWSMIEARVTGSQSALSAKDARIAELESENSHLRHGMTGDYDLDAWLEWCAQKDATPSEDGGEVQELWAVHAQGPDDMYAAFDREDAEKHACELNALPMPAGISVSAIVIPSPWSTAEHWQYLAEQEREHVAQHSRIVAAKDAELRELRDSMTFRTSLIGRLEAELEQLRAQPARKVGGDERTEFGQWFCDEFKKLSPSAGVAMHLAKELYWTGWKARAALAPAAVAVDSSASLINALEQVRTMVGNDEYADDVIGFINRSIYNHARLNRRAIPEGLLERLQHYVNHCDFSEPEWNGERELLQDELRALLGKEGE